MNKLLKNMKKVVSIMLVMSMVFTSHAFVTFAEGVDNAETTVGADNEIVGANSVSPEEDTEETTETTVAEEEAGSHPQAGSFGETHPYNNDEETTVGADSETVGADIILPEDGAEDPTETTDYVEEPEEDVEETKETTTTEEQIETTTVGANSVSPDEETTVAEEEAGSEETTATEEQTEATEETTADEEIEIETEEDKKIENPIYGESISISVSRNPKLNYYVGDYFDPTALALSVYNDMGYSYEVDYIGNEDRFQFWNESTSEDLKNTPFGSAGTIQVGIMYTEGSNHDTTSFNVYVEDACRIKYNKNLPSGYDISGGKNWYEDSISKDPASNPISISGSEDMTCEDSDTKTRKLLGWNTEPNGSGTDYAFNTSIDDPSIFTPNVPLNLYAIWSEPDNFFYIVYFADDASYAQGNDPLINDYLSEMHIRASAGAEAITDEMFSKFDNLSAAEPRGFYRVKRSYGGGEYATTLAEAKEFYHRSMSTTVDNSLDSLRQAYTDWVNDGATADIFYGVLFNSYFYGFDYEGTRAKLEKFKYNEDIDNYLNLVKTNPPTGKEFVKWQYWQADMVNLGPSGYYDYSDEGQLDVYTNIEEKITGQYIQYKDDDGIKELFDGWKDGPYYNLHFGAIYEDIDKKFCVKYYDIDSNNYKNIQTRDEVHNILNLPRVKEFTASNTKEEVNDALGFLVYANGIKKLTKSEYNHYNGIGDATHTDDEGLDEIANKFEEWKASPTETVYYGVNYYHYDSTIQYAENYPSGNWQIYDHSFDWNTDLTPHELVTFHNNNADAIVLPVPTIKGSVDYKIQETSTGSIKNMFEWSLQPDGQRYVRGFGDDGNVWELFSPTNTTLTLYAQWEGDSPTPPTPTKTVSKIDIKTKPTKTTYDSGDAFDPTGLVIKVTYSDSSTEDIDYATHASDFSFNPTTITKSGDVVVTYSGKTAKVAVKVNGGPTPPGPTPPSPGGGGTGGGTGGGGSSDPSKGPMGDLTKVLQQQQQQKATDKKQARKVENDELANLLKSYNENHNATMVNARDDSGNVGHGQWLRIPGSTIWYFLTSDFNQNVTNVNSNAGPNPTQTTNQNKTEGFLVDGWFNLGWDGVDRWYRFDENGIMLMGWWIEDGKTYFLQTDENDNWYGKAMTGTQVIDGITYNFDEKGVLIQ